MTIRVLIADDHPIMRTGLLALLDTESSVTVVAAVGTTAEALAETVRLRPDVVLMDLQFQGQFEGAAATQRIRALENAPAVLILTNYDAESDIVTAIESGAAGYLLKDTPPDDLIAAVIAAASGQSALAPAVATRLLARVREAQSALSVRELEVVSLVADGHSNGDIARLLHLSETTVKSHLAHIFPKLGVTSRTAAVAAARQAGLIR
ncbi:MULTISPECIES: response regulator transcription factor [unclassified Cryobacterium]|jgi:DNA-binding NarL/FixJ family response regulator|uniref:response regulator transcription factor n=1 Tax=unclassified Cryobacterium TaxID=2649013 RepID=UPI002AB5A66F|nr:MULTISPECIES: response regulator transcription factor [unclassified Cryobacterium]MDY7543404.1 response regulator transcription factor [Cryobacterium sp. 5B3]MEA9999723.1 response regulator transcription factor [Cryobacterium sp. RTS3]MEB0264951.1 response regulator transcription factor [Cryobacterium sp. 10I5]MEB0274726.1 response regulator transcription factor [Cryobacterium sp. 5B3]